MVNISLHQRKFHLGNSILQQRKVDLGHILHIIDHWRMFLQGRHIEIKYRSRLFPYRMIDMEYILLRYNKHQLGNYLKLGDIHWYCSKQDLMGI